MENTVINPFYHEHTLILVENGYLQRPIDCYGCGKVVTNLEAAYVCTEKHCHSGLILHKMCGESPNQIFHPKHTNHSILLFDYHKLRASYSCDVCLCDCVNMLGYRCSICDFDVDLNCGKLIEMEKQLTHPSHPDHPLTLIRRPAFSFRCDGCGEEDVDMAYICTTCEFWIHKACASLPLIHHTNHHHHNLSLAFSFPTKHHKYISYCDVCSKSLYMIYWVYFCGECRFFAHINCATSMPERVSNLYEHDTSGSHVIEFPLHAQDILVELITPFVMRVNKVPDLKDMPTTIKMPETTGTYSFLFNYHKHHLTLVSETHENHHKIIDDEDEDDTTNDELKICNLCITPISFPPYYECVACKYFVHSICSLLPKTISSSSSSPDSSNLFNHCPKTQNENHTLTLYTSSESMDMSIAMYKCTCCHLLTNGMVYECDGCKMKIDVKCASLPPSIKHVSHSHHKPLVMKRTPSQRAGRSWKFKCCKDGSRGVIYCCSSDDCDFALHLKCMMLPARLMMLKWDKHPLLLTFDASFDHSSDFICGFCEEEIHPKRWMYHCRQCDNSFHCFCLKAASGWYRNIKFGRRFVLDRIHHHPLTLNCITIKKRCDICRRVKFNYCGLECALCNYLVCLLCASKELASTNVSCMGMHKSKPKSDQIGFQTGTRTISKQEGDEP